jgi:hypothetical protein
MILKILNQHFSGIPLVIDIQQLVDHQLMRIYVYVSMGICMFIINMYVCIIYISIYINIIQYDSICMYIHNELRS